MSFKDAEESESLELNMLAWMAGPEDPENADGSTTPIAMEQGLLPALSARHSSTS